MGSGDVPGARRLALLALGLCLTMQAIISTSYYALAGRIVRSFTHDEEVVAAALRVWPYVETDAKL